MRNPGLLRFLAAVRAQESSAAPLTRLAGMDVNEFTIAMREAQTRDLVQSTGKMHPPLTLTEAGHSYAAAELAPFLPLTWPAEGRAA
ncbi:MAG: hypothetical protein AAF376_05065 [Pseudomonadota bacterium]